MKRLGSAVLGVFVLVSSLLIGQGLGTSTPAAQAETTQAIMITPTTCMAVLIGAIDITYAASHCGIVGGAVGFELGLQDIETLVGDGDGRLEAEDFASMSALEANQIQQNDGFAWILAFVDDKAPVSFDVEQGGGKLTDTTVNGFASVPTPDFICAGPGSDMDCGGTSPGTDDGVVIIGLCGGAYPSDPANSLTMAGCTGASSATRGEYVLTVVQERVPADISYTVVGVPRSITFQVFEDTVSTGVELPDGCPLAASVAGFTAALGRPEKTVVIARVADSDENNITGAWVDWKTGNVLTGGFATNLTPTLNLGGFGFGAPNVFCGTRDPGVTPMTITVLPGPNEAAVWNPSALLDTATVDETVIGPPAAIALTSAPAELACDGNSTASVSASITTANGEKVVDGTAVNFSVQVLGSANPINTTTVGGIATTVVSPLASSARGVPVLVSTGVGEPVDYDVESSILVACSGAAGAPPPPPATAGGGGGAGRISPPDTGSAGEGADAGIPWLWSGLGLALGAVLLGSARLIHRRG